MGKRWRHEDAQYYFERFLDKSDDLDLLKADYDRMRTLWLADIKRNAEQHKEIERLKKAEGSATWLAKRGDDWRNQVFEQDAHIQDLEAKVREANVGNERLRLEIKELTRRYRANRNQRIQDLEKENKTLEEENGDLGRRIIELTRKLTAANDCKDYLYRQLGFQKVYDSPSNSL